MGEVCHFDDVLSPPLCNELAGNKEDEEAKMQEWFSLLNAKNELIKRQIELNHM